MLWIKSELMRLTCYQGTEMHCVGETILSSHYYTIYLTLNYLNPSGFMFSLLVYHSVRNFNSDPVSL